jgi:hypothetical protein
LHGFDDGSIVYTTKATYDNYVSYAVSSRLWGDSSGMDKGFDYEINSSSSLPTKPLYNYTEVDYYTLIYNDTGKVHYQIIGNQNNYDTYHGTCSQMYFDGLTDNFWYINSGGSGVNTGVPFYNNTWYRMNYVFDELASKWTLYIYNLNGSYVANITNQGCRILFLPNSGISALSTYMISPLSIDVADYFDNIKFTPWLPSASYPSLTLGGILNDTYPQYSDNDSWVAGDNFYNNITWIDSGFGMFNAFIQHNFTSPYSQSNYTMLNGTYGIDTYNYTYVLTNEGGYCFKSYGNNTANNWNYTSESCLSFTTTSTSTTTTVTPTTSTTTTVTSTTTLGDSEYEEPNITDFKEFFNYGNSVTGNMFINLVLMALWVVIFISLKGYDFPKALAGASFISFIVSIPFVVNQLANEYLTIAFLLASAFSVILLKSSD